MVQAGLTAPYGQYGQAGGDAATLAAQAAAAAAAQVGQGVTTTVGNSVTSSSTANNSNNVVKLEPKEMDVASASASAADVQASLAALEGLNPAGLDQSALAVSWF